METTRKTTDNTETNVPMATTEREGMQLWQQQWDRVYNYSNNSETRYVTIATTMGHGITL